MTITFTLVSLWFSSIHINKQPKIFLAWIINRLSKTLIIFGYYSHVKCIKKDSSKEARRHLVNACFNPCDLIGFERTMRDSVKNLLLIWTLNWLSWLVEPAAKLDRTLDDMSHCWLAPMSKCLNHTLGWFFLSLRLQSKRTRIVD